METIGLQPIEVESAFTVSIDFPNSVQLLQDYGLPAMLVKNLFGSRNSNSSNFRCGLSLIEVLIALTMTLIVLGAMITVFSRASAAMSRKRAMIEMHNRLRVPAELLRSDLERVTVEMRPWALESSPDGYFEYIEGPRRDTSDFTVNTTMVAGRPVMIPSTESTRGDFDDIIAMTVRTDGVPFTGRWVNQAGEIVTIRSNMAEVIWYTDFADRNGDGLLGIDERVSVYRRVLLIRPDLNVALPGQTETGLRCINNVPLTAQNFFLQNDISVSFASGGIWANSVEDLAKRENRFGHAVGGLPAATGYPYPMRRDFLRSVELNEANMSGIANIALGPPTPNPRGPLVRQFAGSDLVIEDVLGFDVRIWSPNAPVHQADPNNGFADNVIVSPGDPSYAALVTGGFVGDLTNSVGLGAFVDLGYGDDLGLPTPAAPIPVQYTGTVNNVMNSPQFSTGPNPKSFLRYPFVLGTLAIGFDTVYDTFSTHYEDNNLNDDPLSDLLVDEAANGLDDDFLNGVDDVGEREIEPPYPFVARGFKITFRTVHRESAQVHQKPVVHSFIRK